MQAYLRKLVGYSTRAGPQIELRNFAHHVQRDLIVNDGVGPRWLDEPAPKFLATFVPRRELEFCRHEHGGTRDFPAPESGVRLVTPKPPWFGQVVTEQFLTGSDKQPMHFG